jgi:hypothetical protein
VLSENSPSCRAKKGLSGSPHEPRNTAWHAISIHKLGLHPLNWLWRPPRAAELLGAACGGLLALISLREIKPSSPGLDPSNALRSCAAHGQLDPTPWGPRALDPPVTAPLRHQGFRQCLRTHQLSDLALTIISVSASYKPSYVPIFYYYSPTIAFESALTSATEL